MFKILDKYIGFTILFSVIRTVLVLVSLSGIIKFIEQLKKVGTGNYNILSAGIFTLFTVPRDVELFFPMAVLLGVLFGLATLLSNKELIIMQAAGFSYLDISISVIKIIIPLVILIMFTGEWIAPVTEQWARNYRTKKMVGQSLTIKGCGLWIKDGNDFIHIQRVINKNKIEDISIYQFDIQKKLKTIIFAASGDYNINSHQWKLIKVDKLLINNKKTINASQSTLMNWKTNLNPQKLEVTLLEPNSLAIRDLYKYVRFLSKNGQKSSIYHLSMWKKILSPFSVIIMTMIALSFIFSSTKKVGIGIMILIGVLSGFVFYLLNECLGNLSLIYGISPLMVVILPNLLFLMFSILLLTLC